MNRVLLILAILLCALSEGVAQNFQKVTGTVSDRDGTLPGVNVFNLRSKNGTVTDVNGAYSKGVKIKNKGSIKETVLNPNDRYSLLNGKTSINQVDVSDYISWKDGLYIFKNEPLKNILARISRYYDIKIQVDETASALSVLVNLT